MKSHQKLEETLPVLILGFPFGDSLSSSRRSPAITVNRGAISSLRRDDADSLTGLQIDGDINPGNSGGPVVDNDGNLLGVASEAIPGARIALAIPAARLERLITCHITGMTADDQTPPGGSATLAAEVTFKDPLHTLRRAWFRCVPHDASVPLRTSIAGQYVPQMESFPLGVTDFGKATASITPKAKPGSGGWICQAGILRTDGTTEYGAPTVLLPGAHPGSAPGAKRTDATNPADPGDDGAIELPADGPDTVTGLPAPITEATPAAGGSLLVLRLEGIAGLSVYDCGGKQIVSTLRLPNENFVYGCGGKTLLVYLPEHNLIQSWSLDTFEKIKTKPSPIAGIITSITMGRSRDDLAIVRAARSTETAASSVLLPVDARTLESIEMPGDAEHPGLAIESREQGGGPSTHFSADATLSCFSEWTRSSSPNGISLHQRQLSGYRLLYQHESAGYLAMGDDGRIYSEGGGIYDRRLMLVKRVGEQIVPSLGATLFLGMNSGSGKLTVYKSSDAKPLGPAGDFPAWKKPEVQADPWNNELTWDRRILFDPRHGRMVFITQKNDRVVNRVFNLKDVLDRAGVDYLVTLSRPQTTYIRGKEWRYQLKTMSRAGGATYKLEFAPEGMSVDADGLITWTPGPQATQKESVILCITDASGEQTYHNFDLYP
jgi:hypothetical protein